MPTSFSSSRNQMERIAALLLKYRFFLLSVLLFGLMVSQTVNGQWVGDFWEHSAVVRELAIHPLSPRHPQLLLNAPHAFFSPYALAVGCMSRLTGLGPVTTLAIAGIVNLSVFLFGLRRFVSLLLPEHAEAATFYTLLFTLVLWGDTAWGYSGFFHLRVLGDVLPYPSLFATALTFIALSIYIRLIRHRNLFRLIPIFAISVVVLLTHPLTFLFLAVGLVALTIGLGRPSTQCYGGLIGLFTLVFLVAAAWPYYPFVKLILSESEVYHPSNRVMYDQVITRILPALIGIPLLTLRVKSDWRDPSGLMFLGLCLIYAYGAAFDKWSYGRVISYIVLVLHLATAWGVSWLESKLTVSLGRLAFSGLIVAITLAFSFDSFIRPALTLATPGRPNTYHQYQFLSEFTKPDDVVLSDIGTSWVVPTFGGKVVAAQHALAFVPDQEARIEAVNRFFAPETSDAHRFEILQRYRVDFLLINKGYVSAWQTMRDSFQSIGRVVFENDAFVLIDLRR